jgi:serine/threonine protein kinase
MIPNEPSRSNRQKTTEINNGDQGPTPFPPPNQTVAYFPEIPGVRLLSQLGRGGMGIIYLGIQETLNRKVAVKIILEPGILSPSGRSRFEREAELLAKVNHPNIVQIYAFGVSGIIPYLVLEYIDGGSLADRMIDELPHPTEAIRIVESVANGIAEAHRLGIIHRDLKPANVLLTSTGVAKITDFGLAKELRDSENLTITGQVLGTPGYMAPEQAKGDREMEGVAADVYALGGILFALLTGKPPFTGSNIHEILDRVTNCPPPVLSEYRDGIGIELESICTRCLQKDPNARFNSADEVAAALRSVTTSFQDQLPSPLRTPPLKLPKKLLRRSIFRGFVVFFSVLLICCFFNFHELTPIRQQSIVSVSNLFEKSPLAFKQGEGDLIVASGDAIEHLGEKITVEMAIARIGRDKNSGRVFFNSKEKFEEPDCFTFTMTGKVFSTLFPEIESNALETRFKNKPVRVKGTISEYKGRAQIEVTEAGQLQILD